MNLEDTWAEQLENIFNDNSKYIDVVNAGIDGQSSFGHIWNLREWINKIDDLKINNIIFYIGINEKEYPGRHDLNIDKVNEDDILNINFKADIGCIISNEFFESFCNFLGE